MCDPGGKEWGTGENTPCSIPFGNCLSSVEGSMVRRADVQGDADESNQQTARLDAMLSLYILLLWPEHNCEAA